MTGVKEMNFVMTTSTTSRPKLTWMRRRKFMDTVAETTTTTTTRVQWMITAPCGHLRSRPLRFRSRVLAA